MPDHQKPLDRRRKHMQIERMPMVKARTTGTVIMLTAETPGHTVHTEGLVFSQGNQRPPNMIPMKVFVCVSQMDHGTHRNKGVS